MQKNTYLKPLEHTRGAGNLYDYDFVQSLVGTPYHQNVTIWDFLRNFRKYFDMIFRV